MPIETTKVERVFSYNGIKLADPHVDMSPDAVREHYAAQYPELTNAAVADPVLKDGKHLYAFIRSVGTKG